MAFSVLILSSNCETEPNEHYIKYYNNWLLRKTKYSVYNKGIKSRAAGHEKKLKIIFFLQNISKKQYNRNPS